MRRAWALVAVLVVLAAAFVCVPAFAVEDDTDIATLSNRYDSINSLGGSTDTSDQVVTDTHIGVLTSVNRALDGATVSFTGEAVGDVINGGDGYKWVTVLSSSGASIGVYMSEDEAAKIVNLGNYSKRGSTLEVRGVYSIACSEHQGELDVHAEEVKVVDAGGRVIHTVNAPVLYRALIMCAAGFALLFVFYFLRHRKSQQEEGQ